MREFVIIHQEPVQQLEAFCSSGFALKRHLPHLALKHVLVSLRDRRLVNTVLKASLGRYL
jgi:hypothetical protein